MPMSHCDVIYHKPSYDDFYCACYSERANTNPINTNALFNDKVEVVQYNAALAITGCVRGTSREKLYDRRSFHRLSLYYKILNNLTPDKAAPEYLRIIIPDSIRRSYAMRADRDNVLPARTQKYNLIRFQLFEKIKKVISLVTLISPPYTINLFLYGNFSLDFRTNQQIVEHTINFIISSKI